MTAMLDLALHGGKRSRHSAGISQRQEHLASYLEQLFGKLRRHTRRSVRGPGGGYTLARDLAQVSVADSHAVDEPRTRPMRRQGKTARTSGAA